MGFELYLIAVMAALVYYLSSVVPFLRQVWRSTVAMKRFPMEKCHWFLGHLGVHDGPTHTGFLQLNDWVRRHPRCFVYFFGPVRPVLVLVHPDTVKELTKTAEPKALSGGGAYSLLLPWLGTGLLVSKGQKWQRNRKLLTPAFHFDILRNYMAVYNTCADTLIAKMARASAQTGRSIDVFPAVSLCTLDIILRCAFSTDQDIQSQGAEDPYVKNVMSLTELVIHRAMRPYLYFDTVYYNTSAGKEFKRRCEFSHNFALNVIEERRQALRNRRQQDNAAQGACTDDVHMHDTAQDSSADEVNKRKYYDFLDILLLAEDDNGQKLSDADILDEVETFMFEGHDTTASAISWCLYNLARYPTIQAKARREVDDVMTGRDSDVITWTDLNALPYLTMCIKESMRLCPPVPYFSRETTKDCVIDGSTVPAGSFIDIVVWCLHHNPTVWPDPLVYDPLRFTPENINAMDSHAYIPFSAGPRNCIGQNFALHELKTVIARVLRRFELQLDDTVEVRFKPDLVLRAENGIHVYCRERRDVFGH